MDNDDKVITAYPKEITVHMSKHMHKKLMKDHPDGRVAEYVRGLIEEDHVKKANIEVWRQKVKHDLRNLNRLKKVGDKCLTS